LLLAAGANPNAKAKSRFTALMVASGYKGAKETVQMLLERGAEAEPHDPPPTFYVSAAYLAAGAGEAETLQLLLDKGANPHRKVLQVWAFPNDTIFMPLVMHADTTLGPFLPHFTKDELNEGLVIAVIDNRCATVGELLSRGADVNHIDKFGMTALQYAASTGYGEPQMVELLLRSGADTKLRTKDGLTALVLAKKYGNAEIQRVLERAGAVE
jgi:ankyrin repeat protein